MVQRKTTWQEQGEGVPVRKRWHGEVLGQNSRASASDDERSASNKLNDINLSLVIINKIIS